MYLLNNIYLIVKAHFFPIGFENTERNTLGLRRATVLILLFPLSQICCRGQGTLSQVYDFYNNKNKQLIQKQSRISKIQIHCLIPLLRQ